MIATRVARFLIEIRRSARRVPVLLARSLKTLLPRLAIAAAAVFVALLIAETAVRVLSPDWRYLMRLLYFQTADLWAHKPDPDPEILYRLRPGRYRKGSFHVNINSFGARGPERTEKKPPGVFRIICVGASNVYGANVNDEIAWPAQLEKELNKKSPGRYEVWNMGVSAYVAVQIAAVAREAVERYEPDLVIFAISNRGPRAFLWGSAVKDYFTRDPDMWRYLFSPKVEIPPHFLSYGTKLRLLTRVALYRYILFYLIGERGYGWMVNGSHETLNLEASRRFFEWARGRTRVCFFFYPKVRRDEEGYSDYIKGADLPALYLSDAAAGLPEYYQEVHPPPHVFEWYAREIAGWLRAQNLAPD